MTKLEMIHHEHKFKPYRKSMGRDKMAAQFLPFAALTGFDQIILNTAKKTEEQKKLFPDKLEELNRKLMFLMRQPNVEISVTYFEPDLIKEGGKYLIKTGKIRKIDKDSRSIIFKDGDKIYFKFISDIKSNFFSDF